MAAGHSGRAGLQALIDYLAERPTDDASRLEAAIARLQCRQHFREHHRSVPGIGAGRRHDIRYGEQITNAKSTMLRTALTNRFVATPVKGRKKMPAGL